MLVAPTFLYRYCATVALASVLAACAPSPPQPTGTPTLEQRVLELERRMQALETSSAVALPQPGRADIQAQIESLERQRVKLLARYYDEHPAIRDIDHRLEILHTQLKLAQ